MELKDIIFFLGAMVSIPAGILVGRSSRRFLDFVLAALIFSTCLPGLLDINFVSREFYRGTSRGFGISYVDFLSVILLLSPLLAPPQLRRPWHWPGSLAIILLYTAWAAVSVAMNEPRLFGMFELVKFGRGILLFLAVAMYVRTPREVKVIGGALCAVILMEFSLSIVQRYAWGMYRLTGAFDHFDQYAGYCNIVAPVLLALSTAKASGTVGKLCGLCAALAGLCVIFTISRTGFAVYCLAMGLVILITFSEDLSGKRLLIILMILMGASLVVYKAWDTLSKRYSEATLTEEIEDDTGRGMYFRLGRLVVRDYPIWGLGLNNWSYIVTGKYYDELGLPSAPYSGTDVDFSGLTENEMKHMIAPPAHNVFILTMGEMGLPGLALLLALWMRWLQMAGWFLIRRQDDFVGRFGTGTFFAFMACMLTNMTEYGFREITAFYLIHALTGALAGLYAFRYIRRDKRGALLAPIR